MAIDPENEEVLWHSPTEYNPLRHCPPYLPGLPYRAGKLSAEQKAEVRSFVKSASFGQLTPVSEQTPMVGFLALLQMLALLHQSHHWSTKGSAFYEDHLLFERLYNESLEFIDALAEKAVGTQAAPAISALHEARLMVQFLEALGPVNTPEEMVQASLKAEVACLEGLETLLEFLEEDGSTTPGIENLLGAIADKHESFVYLLRQRSGGLYSYNRT